ncbi:hypothetical protein AVEN_227586-1 [Araneus ventricosus]|uniref:Uncharacterized protein n=1 Tax=Araneus ventricosus TaxID=182803 RepID=A0A4Y2K8G9_ARAVE|nr:hypothetical protein AVEN_227586-1 [Araneus ventricosus]
MLTLTEIALRKVAIMLWSKPENLHSLKYFRFVSRDSNGKLNEWHELITTVAEQASHLELPATLKKELASLLKPIGSEFLKFRSFVENFFYGNSELVDYMDANVWTDQGSIDYCQTAEKILNQKQLNNIFRFQFCCLFCLEDYIREIWGMLSDQEKALCYRKENLNPLHEGVLSYWICTLSVDLTPVDCLIQGNIFDLTVYQYAFENSAATGNFAATKYFFPKLTYSERVESLVTTACGVANKIRFWLTTRPEGVPRESYHDILCYLLEEMNTHEQVEVFQRRAFIVLLCYLDWPRTKLFPQLLDRMWSFISPVDYHQLVCVLAKRLTMSAYKYSPLFRECFLKSPLALQSVILEEQINKGCFLSHLFDVEDVENIQVVLRHYDRHIKEIIFTCDAGIHICHKLILKEKWQLLELFIRECMIVEEIKPKIITNYRIFMHRCYERNINWGVSYKYCQFFEMLRATKVPQDINQNLGGENSSAKRIRIN